MTEPSPKSIKEQEVGSLLDNYQKYKGAIEGIVQPNVELKIRAYRLFQLILSDKNFLSAIDVWITINSTHVVVTVMREIINSANESPDEFQKQLKLQLSEEQFEELMSHLKILLRERIDTSNSSITPYKDPSTIKKLLLENL